MLRCALEVLERDIKHRNHKKPDRAHSNHPGKDCCSDTRGGCFGECLKIRALPRAKANLVWP